MRESIGSYGPRQIAVRKNCHNLQFLCTVICHACCCCAEKLRNLQSFGNFTAHQCLAGANCALAVHCTCARCAPAVRFEPPRVYGQCKTQCIYARDVHKVLCICSVHCQGTHRCNLHVHCTRQVHGAPLGALTVYTISSLTEARWACSDKF